MFKKTSLGIIVPCYNEINNVDFFERELEVFLERVSLLKSFLSVKFYIIDNNSVDGSAAKLNLLAARFSDYLVIDKCHVQGYGAALKYGFNKYNSYFEYLGFLDFDNTYPLDSLIELTDKISREDLDMVYGARLHQGSKIDIVRSFGNRLYVGLLKLILRSSLSDVCTGMRVFRSALVEQVLTLDQNDLSFSLQLTAHAVLNKWRLGEVPISYRIRVGDSKLSVIIDGFKFLFILFRTIFNKYV